MIVNWGAHAVPDYLNHTPLKWRNYPLDVAKARNKLVCLQTLAEAGVPTVEWTEDPAVAAEWWKTGADIFVRHSVTGQGGSGIQVVTQDNEHGVIPDAPLYTKRFRATHEYRAHVFANTGAAPFVVKKRRAEGAVPNLVRNHANGYVYCLNNVTVPDSVNDAARAAVIALGLDFGAVDILCTINGEARVLEVNTAPGLVGRTIDYYARNLSI
jgi:glutathione synthase/RimK-type ligase-like ATP-grasp enzyme